MRYKKAGEGLTERITHTPLENTPSPRVTVNPHSNTGIPAIILIVKGRFLSVSMVITVYLSGCWFAFGVLSLLILPSTPIR